LKQLIIFFAQRQQTGPAKRNDLKTIEAHQLFCIGQNQSTIYKIITQSIQDMAKVIKQ
jgi:hypothetical protein